MAPVKEQSISEAGSAPDNMRSNVVTNWTLTLDGKTPGRSNEWSDYSPASWVDRWVSRM